MEYSDVVADPNTVMPFSFMDGTYFWRVKSLANCGETDWSEVFEFTVLTVGVEALAAPQFSLFPNPTADEFNYFLGMARLFTMVLVLFVVNYWAPLILASQRRTCSQGRAGGLTGQSWDYYA